MTDKEKNILKLLKSYLSNEIDFQTLDNKWLEFYTEDDDHPDYFFDDSFHEIAELIYIGSESEPSSLEKSYGLLGPEELRRRITVELEKNENWKKHD